MNIEKEMEFAISNGYISKKKHGYLDLFILCYTEKAIKDQYWLPETINAEGLMVDSSWNIVNRYTGKIFTLDELDEMGIEVPEYEPVIFKKFFGCFGYVYFDDIGKRFLVAERDSFDRNRSIDFSTLLKKKKLSGFKDGYSYKVFITDDVKNMYLVSRTNIKTGVSDFDFKGIDCPEMPGDRYDTMDDLLYHADVSGLGVYLFYEKENLWVRVNFDKQFFASREAFLTKNDDGNDNE